MWKVEWGVLMVMDSGKKGTHVGHMQKNLPLKAL